MAKNQSYLAMWCNEGLECMVNITAIEKAAIIAALKEEKLPTYPNLQALILRAQFNCQRHYEIYAFNSVVSEKEMRKMFKETPQAIVDVIRRLGKCIYSDRKTKPSLIT